MKHGIIDKSEKNYKVGERTNAYRLCTEYLGQPFTSIDCPPAMDRKALKYTEKKNKERAGKNYKLHWELKQILTHYVTIDAEAAFQYIHDQMIHSLNHPDTIQVKEHEFFRKGNFYPKEELTPEQEKRIRYNLITQISLIVEWDFNMNISYKKLKRVLDQYHSGRIAIERIQKGGNNFNFKIDDAGRIHTNIKAITAVTAPT